MSKAGYPYDNAPMERYFNTLKNELINLHYYHSDKELNTAIDEQNPIRGAIWVMKMLELGCSVTKMLDQNTAEQQELLALRKRNKQLEMENDILKQAALILGRK